MCPVLTWGRRPRRGTIVSPSSCVGVSLAERVNRHGLARSIPADVKRAVRRRCKFACVICDSAFVQYDHFKPEFADARTHDPDGITLLCGGCHARVTAGSLSRGKVLAADQRRRDGGIPRPHVLLETHLPVVAVLGTVFFFGSGTVLEADGVPILSLSESEAGGVALSAKVFDLDGKLVLTIDHNELAPDPQLANNASLATDVSDIEFQGEDLKIRGENRKILLHLRVSSPAGLQVCQINMKVGTWRFSTDDEGRISILADSGGGISMSRDSVILCRGAIRLSEKLQADGGLVIMPRANSRRLLALVSAARIDQLVFELSIGHQFNLFDSFVTYTANIFLDGASLTATPQAVSAVELLIQPLGWRATCGIDPDGIRRIEVIHEATETIVQLLQDRWTAQRASRGRQATGSLSEFCETVESVLCLLLTHFGRTGTRLAVLASGTLPPRPSAQADALVARLAPTWSHAFGAGLGWVVSCAANKPANIGALDSMLNIVTSVGRVAEAGIPADPAVIRAEFEISTTPTHDGIARFGSSELAQFLNVAPKLQGELAEKARVLLRDE